MTGMAARRGILGVVALLVTMSLAPLPAAAQATWIFSQCDQNQPVLYDNSVESKIPGDPVAAGALITTDQTSCISPVPSSSQFFGRGGLAIDRVNKLVYATDGLIAPSGALTFEIRSLKTAKCAGTTTSCITVPGPSPFIGNEVAGIDFEYGNVNGTDLPVKIWCVSFTDYSFIKVSYPGPTYAWHTTKWSIPNGNFPVSDVAFGITQTRNGAAWNPPMPTLFATEVTSSGMVDVLQLNSNGSPGIIRFSSSGLFAQGGITLDTSMPQEEAVGSGINMRTSGRILVIGQTAQAQWVIRELETVPSIPWTPAGLNTSCSPIPFVTGLAYSAELTSLGFPCGGGCGPNDFGSSPLVDTVIDAAANIPGQPLVPLPPSVTPTLRLNTCSVQLTGKTPYLIYQNNGVSPVNVGGCSLIVDPLGSTVPIVPVAFPFDFDPSSILVPQPAPVAWNAQSYYYCQFVFMCGASAPFDPYGSPFVASEPFRVAISNPH